MPYLPAKYLRHHTLFHWYPMKRFKDRCYMVILWSVCNQSCNRILKETHALLCRGATTLMEWFQNGIMVNGLQCTNVPRTHMDVIEYTNQNASVVLEVSKTTLLDIMKMSRIYSARYKLLTQKLPVVCCISICWTILSNGVLHCSGGAYV